MLGTIIWSHFSYNTSNKHEQEDRPKNPTTRSSLPQHSSGRGF